jgi:hypothetical protein
VVVFALTPLISWVELGARGSIPDMHAALAQITDARPNPRVRISQWNPDGKAKPLPPPDHNAQARADVMTRIMVPAMVINGCIDEVLAAAANDKALSHGSEWELRYLLSRGEFDKAIAMYRARASRTQAIMDMRPILEGLASAGNYATLDALRLEMEARFPSFTSLWSTLDQMRSLRDALRRGDRAEAEAYVQSLEADPKNSNWLSIARGELIAHQLRAADWGRAEAQMARASGMDRPSYVSGRPPHEAWLMGADAARRAGNDAVAARWKAEAKARFCARNPNLQAPKIGGVNPDVLRFLQALYAYTAIEQGLLPDQPLMHQPAWAR